MGWWGRFRGRELPLRDHVPERETPGAMRDDKKHGLWIEKPEPGGNWGTGLLECLYRDGVRQGPYRYWHSTGFLSERGTFVDGAKDGEIELFHRDGWRACAVTFRAGKLHGMYRAWKQDGSIKYEREFRDGNIYAGSYDLESQHGDWLSWRKTYKDGHPIGVWEENDFKGRPEKRRTYDDDGVLDGPWSDHHEGGEVKLAGAYAKGSRAGVWEWKAKDGALIARCDYGRDGVWVMPDGTALPARDEDDLARWIELAGAMGGRHGFYITSAIDKWPEDDRERAIAWVEARRGPHAITVGIGEWLGALIDRDGDPRCRLIGGISTDHGSYKPEHVARMVGHAHAMRVLSFYEEQLGDGAASLFPPGVAWPKLEKLSIYECGGLGAVVRTLAGAAWTTALRELTLDDEGDTGDADAAALIASPHLASLRELYLGGMTMGAAFAKALASAPMLASLEELELRYPRDAPKVVEAIAARETPKLKSLELYGEGELSRNTVIGLCAKTRHPALESLTLQDFEISEKVVAEIKKKYPSLELYVY